MRIKRSKITYIFGKLSSTRVVIIQQSFLLSVQRSELLHLALIMVSESIKCVLWNKTTLLLVIPVKLSHQTHPHWAHLTQWSSPAIFFLMSCFACLPKSVVSATARATRGCIETYANNPIKRTRFILKQNT